jgi:hypothetical protein
MSVTPPSVGLPATSPWGPEDRRIAVAFVVIATVVQLPELLWSPPDGKAINNAIRILDGDVPYRDFWSMYAPGHFYLVALLFKLFGLHVWVPGIARLVLVATDGALIFVLTRRLGLGRVPAGLAGAGLVGMLWVFGPTISSYETSMLFLLSGVERAVAYIQGRGRAALVAAGVCCGIGGWFKHDISAYVTLGIIAGLSVSWLLAGKRRPSSWVSPLGIAARVGGGALVTLLPMVTFLAVNAGPEAWQDLIVFPATDFRVVRGEGYPPFLPQWELIGSWLASPLDPLNTYHLGRHLSTWLTSNLPQLVFVAGVIVLAAKRRTLDPQAIAVTAISLATMPLFWASAHVQRNTNFWSLWIFSIILGSVALTRLPRATRLRRALSGVFVVYTGALLIAPAMGAAQVAYFWRNHATLDFPIVAGVRLPRARYEDIHPIVSFIRDSVPESEAIYAGLMRHDSVVISNQNFYYLSGRRMASRYNELHPGVVDREAVQREIVADINRLNVRCAVLWNFGWPKAYMDSILEGRRRQIPDIGATLLDEFFAENFEQVAQYGEFILVWRKGVPLPPGAVRQ